MGSRLSVLHGQGIALSALAHLPAKNTLKILGLGPFSQGDVGLDARGDGRC